MNCICIFGPSCSGKSTLASRLQIELGALYIDRDVLIENGCEESRADEEIDRRLSTLKEKVIVDAQVPWREKRKLEKYVLVLPPLSVLLERDEKRTQFLQRSPDRAFWARRFVVETHETLQKMPKTFFDICLDSSAISVDEEVQLVKEKCLF